MTRRPRSDDAGPASPWSSCWSSSSSSASSSPCSSRRSPPPSARPTTRGSRARSRPLAAGLARFKDTYGEYPPSRVILSEQGCYSEVKYVGDGVRRVHPAGPTTTAITTALSGVATAHWLGTVPADEVRHAGHLVRPAWRSDPSARSARFFPRVAGPTATAWHDFNGNNNLDSGFIYLEGHECLVFFLGGIPSPTTNSTGIVGFGMSGFGKNPDVPVHERGRHHESDRPLLRIQGGPTVRRRRRRDARLSRPPVLRERRGRLRLLRLLRDAGIRPERREFRRGNRLQHVPRRAPRSASARRLEHDPIPRAESVHEQPAGPVSSAGVLQPAAYMNATSFRSSRPAGTTSSARAASM